MKKAAGKAVVGQKISAKKKTGGHSGFVLQYQAVLDSRQLRFDEYFDEPDWRALHEAAHIRLLEVEKLVDEAGARREHRMFSLATQLLADGLCSIACANYQLAFFSLRSFLEMSTAAIKFSAFEFELRHWEGGTHDILWNSISVGDRGVYSKSFAEAFFSPLSEEHKHYQVLASRVYREASEYVHANPSAHSAGEHDDQRIRQWFSLFDAGLTCFFYGFFVRYNSDLDFSEASSPELAALLMAELGHFSGVSQSILKVGG